MYPSSPKRKLKIKVQELRTIELEEWEGTLVERIFIDGRRTTAYILPQKDNEYLFTPDQLNLINNQIF